MGQSPLQSFHTALAAIPAPIVIELGTCRSRPHVATHHQAWAPDARRYWMTDIAAGPDVDFVTDAHRMGLADDSCDVVISCSTYEHLEKPWVVTDELFRVVRAGGVAFVQTHQSFPLHAYPKDYWRFTTSALTSLFSRWDVLACDYEFPAAIVPTTIPDTCGQSPAWLNVSITARKR